MGKKKATQEELPGMEARDVPEIEQAAENYRRIRDERCALSRQEAEAKAALIQVMKNKGRSYYSYNGLNVQLSNQENVRVKSKDEDEDYEPVGRFTKAEDSAPAQEYLPEADEPITDEERERLHREAVSTWRRERPASDEAEEEEEDEDHQAEWLAGLTDDERNRYYTAPCECGHERQWHGEEDRDTADRRCSLCKCEVYHCPVCDTKRGHQASCDYYALGEGTPVEKAESDYVCQGCGAEVDTDLGPTDGLCSRCWTPDAIKDPQERAAFIAENSDEFTPGFPPGFDPERAEQGLAQVVSLDDYTAARCDECKMIDGGHAQTCSKSDALRFDDYLAYARAHYKGNHQSHARKMDLTKLKDDEVRAWKQQQAGNSVEAEPEPKSPVEQAIDR